MSDNTVILFNNKDEHKNLFFMIFNGFKFFKNIAPSVNFEELKLKKKNKLHVNFK